jgi:polysaccharide export outer membrane protein
MQTHSRNSTLVDRLLRLAGSALICVMAGVAGGAEQSLGAGDTVRVVVAENPDLTTEARLSLRGTLAMPLLGEINLAGRTPASAGEAIAAELRKNRYLRDPQVSVMLVEAHSQRVQVLGHVAKPGQYALDGTNERLSDVLALAGGRTADGSDRVVVTRRSGSGERFEIDVAGMYRNGDLSHDITLAAGDAVYVPSAPVFYVYGAVQRAGVYRLEPDTSVRAALSIGGGLTPRASQRIQINRRMPDGKIHELRGQLADRVEADDVIFVKESLF